jgi:hypothetical protein
VVKKLPVDLQAEFIKIFTGFSCVITSVQSIAFSRQQILLASWIMMIVIAVAAFQPMSFHGHRYDACLVVCSTDTHPYCSIHNNTVQESWNFALHASSTQTNAAETGLWL